MKKQANRLLALAFVCLLALSPLSLLAQITNTPTGVASSINTTVGPSFDTALNIAVTATAVLMVIYYVRKALKMRG